MKKLFLSAMAVLALMSCSGDKEKAQNMLDNAKKLYAEGEYNSAKQKLDSIRTVYPKEFEVIKEGITLMRSIELKENERTLAYTDSMLVLKNKEAEDILKDFEFVANSEYDKDGFFIYKGMNVERNVERCYLRSGVNNNGEMYLASVYYGKGGINHNSLKVELKDSSNAQTVMIPYDGGTNYRFSDGGNISEIVTYKNGKDNGVISFINNFEKERIKVTYMGDKRYVFYMDDLSKKSISRTFELSIILSDIVKLQQENDIARSKIDYLENNISAREKRSNN